MRKVLVITVLLLSMLSFGKDWYVKQDGNNDSTGTSWDGALKWISLAIEKADSADTIMLRGIFNLDEDAGVVQIGENSGLNVGKTLTFSGEDPSKTIIQGVAVFVPDSITWRIFYIKNYREAFDIQVTIENVTIRHGHGEPSGGIYASLISNSILSSLTINNCIITENISSDFKDNSLDFGGAGISVNGGNLIINNSIIKNNLNTNFVAAAQVKGGGGIFYEPLFDGSFCTIENTAIIDNLANQYGGGIWIRATNDVSSTFNLNNCTISGNSSILDGKGSALFVSSYKIKDVISKTNLNLTINSCTIADNKVGYAIYNQLLQGQINANIKNSIIKNSTRNDLLQNFYPNIQTGYSDCYTLSYSVIDDASLIANDNTSVINYKDPIIKEEISDEYGTSFYKVVEGSPAKDAIPLGEDESNPFNGAGNYVVDEDTGLPILDEYGNIQVLDQRGKNFWNQAKDIGAYESPYYWVDVTADDDDYKTIPKWKTDLTIADEIEGWTDYMRAQTGGRIVLTEDSEIERFGNSELRWNDGSFMDVAANSRIINGLDFFSGNSINVLDNAQLSLQGTNATIPSNTSMTIGNNSSLIVENETNLKFADGAVIKLGEDAEIRVMDGGELITNNNASENVTFKNKTGMWYSIVGELGSTIKIDDAEIIGAEIGVCGTPTNCSVTNSRFLDCENGISLVNCGDYTISDNAFSGKGIGTGITLTYCSDPIVGNSVSNFAEGVKLVSSSITLAKNKINNNINNGLYVTGHGSKPLLVNAVTRDAAPELRSFNNEIKDNCLNNPYYNGAQIYLRYSAGVYMTGGCNNVFSGGVGTIPTVPCIKGIINITPDPTINKVTIAAERNYWGYGSIDSFNKGIFFDLPNTKPIEGEIETGYFIDYEPYGKIPFVEGGIYPMSDLSSNEPSSNESILLFNALKLEQLDNLKPSIKLYEQIVKKYPDTPEYFVAITRLPELYVADERSLEPLITSYDEALETENTSVKKFFKEMKVSTHIKGKNYDKAIELAEEMKAEAEGEDEILLSEIDIAIASMLKEAESDSKGRQNSYSDTLNKLLSKLNGSDNKEQPADISENAIIPSEIKLYQNYPNPFNPVTQIKFDLAKPAKVRLSVYNVNGQLVSELASGVMNAGSHSVDFNGSKINSGVYYYNLVTNGKNITKKMVLTK